MDELALLKASASSGLSSVASQGDAVAGHSATGSWETSESPVSKYKDTKKITILQINPKEISGLYPRLIEAIKKKLGLDAPYKAIPDLPIEPWLLNKCIPLQQARQIIVRLIDYSRLFRIFAHHMQSNGIHKSN